MNKLAQDLKKGDETPWYTVIEDATQGTADDGPVVLVRIQWNDGGIDTRVFDLDTEVPVK